MPVLISVVIITHNREKYLFTAIDSVLRQKFSNFELIIIDDASTDNTESVMQQYLSDNRIKYIKIVKANSIAQVRNSAWPYVNGKYVAVLDSDDIWCDELKLSRQFEFLEKNPDVVLVGSGAILINNEGKEIGQVIKPISDAEIKKDFFIKNPIIHSSVMYRYDEIKKIGAYNENMTYCDDMDLWLRLGEVGKLHNFPEALIKYRVHGDNESVKNSKGAIVDVLKFIGRNRKKYGIGWSVFLKKFFYKFFEYLKK